jgi:hypothetical protein
MKNYLIIIVALAITFCFLPAHTKQEKKSTPASSDTTGVQENKLKKQGPRQKFKEHKPVKDEMVPGRIDSFRIMLDRPLLRLKDTSQNNFH